MNSVTEILFVYGRFCHGVWLQTYTDVCELNITSILNGESV